MYLPDVHALRPDPDDRPLRAARGDRDARASLVAELGPRVWGLCRRLCPEPEDAYQDVWGKVFASIGRFDPAGPATLSTWVITVAHRHLVDLHRRRQVRGEVVELGELPAPAGPDVVEERQRGERIEAALQRLPESHRRVVVLHHLHDRPLDAIAREEGVALGTVKSRLHRARARLLELLGDGW